MMNPRPYTVLLLRPDTDWDGVPADWVLRMHVDVTSVDATVVREAIEAAIWTAVRKYYTGPDGDLLATFGDFAVLAVFPGHVTDLYDPRRRLI
jgi:hypothetical protein